MVLRDPPRVQHAAPAAGRARECFKLKCRSRRPAAPAPARVQAHRREDSAVCSESENSARTCCASGSFVSPVAYGRSSSSSATACAGPERREPRRTPRCGADCHTGTLGCSRRRRWRWRCCGFCGTVRHGAACGYAPSGLFVWDTFALSVQSAVDIPHQPFSYFSVCVSSFFSS